MSRGSDVHAGGEASKNQFNESEANKKAISLNPVFKSCHTCKTDI